MKRPRLIEVHVTPVMVIDDGENLEPFPQREIIIPAAEWPTYSSERFPKEIKEWEEKLNAPEEKKPNA